MNLISDSQEAGNPNRLFYVVSLDLERTQLYKEDEISCWNYDPGHLANPSLLNRRGLVKNYITVSVWLVHDQLWAPYA